MAWIAHKPLGKGRASKAWYVYWRDDARQKCEMCRTPDGQPITLKPAAQAYLAAWVADREKGGMGLTDPFKRHLDTPAVEHLAAYLSATRARARLADSGHAGEIARVLSIVFDAIGQRQKLAVVRLRDITPSTVNDYLDSLAARNTATTQNRHRQYVVSYLNWCVADKRLAANPITPTACPKRQTRHTYKGKGRFSIAELAAITAAIKTYPITARTTNNGGRPRADGTPAIQRKPVRLTPDTVAKLERVGVGRQLAYRLAIAAYLRRRELTRLTVEMFDGKNLRVPGHVLKVGMAGYVEWELPPTLAVDLAAYVTARKAAPSDRLLPQVTNVASWAKLHKAHLRAAGVPLEGHHGALRTFHSLRTTVNLILEGRVRRSARLRFCRHASRNTNDVSYSGARDGRPLTAGKIGKLLARLDARLIHPPAASGKNPDPVLTPTADPN